MTPPVSDDDFRKPLIPAIDRSIALGDRIRILAIVEAGFSDFTLGAILQYARTGLKHWLRKLSITSTSPGRRAGTGTRAT